MTVMNYSDATAEYIFHIDVPSCFEAGLPSFSGRHWFLQPLTIIW